MLEMFVRMEKINKTTILSTRLIRDYHQKFEQNLTLGSFDCGEEEEEE